VDELGREILISNKHGLKAKDACGTVIHDIPDSAILSGMSYGGHIILLHDQASLANIQFSYTDTTTSRDVTSATTNTSLAGLLSGNTNAKALIVVGRTWVQVAAAKQTDGLFISVEARYSKQYDVAPPSYSSAASNVISSKYACIPKVSTADFTEIDYTADCIIPIVWSGGVPYITWNARFFFATGTASSAAYLGQIWLHIKGIVI
jgi:hypothetical protein